MCTHTVRTARRLHDCRGHGGSQSDSPLETVNELKEGGEEERGSVWESTGGRTREDERVEEEERNREEEEERTMTAERQGPSVIQSPSRHQTSSSRWSLDIKQTTPQEKKLPVNPQLCDNTLQKELKKKKELERNLQLNLLSEVFMNYFYN